MPILEPEDKRTLGDLCNFIADNAEKEAIRPVKLFGNNCGTAAIFKSLKRRLANRGIDISDLRPSSQLEPLVKKYKSVLIEEINQLAPTVLPPIDFKTNWVYKWGLRLLLTFLFVTFFLAWKESGWAWATGGICLIGYIMIWLGARLDPEQASFKDIYTVADLVRKIDRGKTWFPIICKDAFAESIVLLGERKIDKLQSQLRVAFVVFSELLNNQANDINSFIFI